MSLGEGCRHDGRALSADSCADGHEESDKMLVYLPRRLMEALGSIPKCSCRTEHVLAQSPHHTIRARSEANDVGCAEDEANDKADS